MPASPLRLTLFAAISCAICLAADGASAKAPDDLAGTWVLASGKRGAKCRILLRADKADNGDFFLGMPAACRHSMPKTESIGRWSAADDTHLVLADPAGTAILSFTGAGSTFTASSDDGSFTLQKTAAAPPRAAGFDAVDTKTAETLAALQTPPAAAAPAPTRMAKAAATPNAEAIANLPGRYAVMRDKRDTGCMLTLDKTRSKGADRAQLAPGCRDQGIVVFDPASWQVIKGELVLTARAGHKTRLLSSGEGAWEKDPKAGGKPLGLKRL